MPAKKEKKGLRALYTRLESIEDLARSAAGERSCIFAVKSGTSYKMMCEGESIGEGRIIHHFDSKRTGRYLVYSTDEESGERAELADDVTQRNDHYKSQRIPIIEIVKDPYSAMGKGDLKGVSSVEAKDGGALARALVNDMGEDESPKLYSFAAGKERIIGTLAFLKGSDKTFIYSRVGQKGPFPAISYDYNSDTVEMSKSFNGAAKIRIRVINLAEQPPFFKG